MNKKQARKNITIMKRLYPLRGFLLIMAVTIPYFESRGLNLSQIAMTQVVFASSAFLFEVPSGYISDRLGHAKVIKLAAVFWALGFTIYAFANGFWGFALAELVLGMGFASLSGSDRALVRESLEELGQEDGSLRFFARTRTLVLLGEIVASLAGALLAIIALRAPFIVQVFVQLIILWQVSGLKDMATSHRGVVELEARKVREDIRVLARNPQLLKAILLLAVFGVSTHTTVWFVQSYWGEAGVPIGLFGVLWSVQLLLTAAFTASMPLLASRVKARTMAISSAVGLTVSYVVLGLAVSAWLIPAFIAAAFVRAYSTVVLPEHIDQHTAPQLRATAHSVQGVVHKLLYIPMLLALGQLADLVSLKAVFTASAVVYGMLMVTMIYLYRKQW